MRRQKQNIPTQYQLQYRRRLLPRSATAIYVTADAVLSVATPQNLPKTEYQDQGDQGKRKGGAKKKK